jgi:hypothetical protein
VPIEAIQSKEKNHGIEEEGDQEEDEEGHASDAHQATLFEL